MKKLLNIKDIFLQMDGIATFTHTVGLYRYLIGNCGEPCASKVSEIENPKLSMNVFMS